MMIHPISSCVADSDTFCSSGFFKSTDIFVQAVDRIGRSAAKDEMVSSDWIVLSCEEDYADCVPFLEKG